jgi:hypothetical protein
MFGGRSPMLTLLRASKHRTGGPWSEDDFDVVDDEGTVARIMWTAASFTAGRGNAANLEDAKRDFKARWLAVSANGRPRLP